MGKKKSERLGTLKKLAEWKERDAAAAVGQHRERLQLENQQLLNLRSYYSDYLETIDQQTQLATRELINYRSFCQQLANTIRQGEQRVATLEKELDIKKTAWLLCCNKRQVLEEMVQRSAGEESQAAEKQTQKEIEDIWVTQRHHNHPTP